MKCKLKKYIILGSVLFLFVASCNRNENGETSKEAKNNKEVVKMPDKDQIEKYSEYAELKKVTFTEEWNDNIFKEIFHHLYPSVPLNIFSLHYSHSSYTFPF